MNRRERQERFEALRRIGCLACQIEDKGLWCGTPEIHHLNKFGLKGKERMGDEYTVVLGRWHHRGIPLEGWTVVAMTKKFGPSWYHDKVQFVFAYGNNTQLLLQMNAKLLRLAPEPA